ncbi:hypothetical protein [Kordia sp.]|uniref:hypothetical protein n=1 Tax=Kordia sp. TaxID=1965332 RepID=UPI003B5A2138
MKELNDEIKNIESEMLECRNALIRMKKRIPLGILACIGFCFIFPYLPGRRGRKPMIETWGYQNAVLFGVVIFPIVCAVCYIMAKSKLEKKLRELKLKKYLAEKEIEEFNTL